MTVEISTLTSNRLILPSSDSYALLFNVKLKLSEASSDRFR